MATEFGKVLRIIRINTGDSLRDMATKLGVSAAYLSAIENGKRSIPNTIFQTICDNYALTETDKSRLKEAMNVSVNTVKINLTDLAEEKKQVIVALAKNEIDDDTIAELCEIIKKNRKEG